MVEQTGAMIKPMAIVQQTGTVVKPRTIVEQIGAMVKPRTLDRGVPGSSLRRFAIRCGLQPVKFPKLLML